MFTSPLASLLSVRPPKSRRLEIINWTAISSITLLFYFYIMLYEPRRVGMDAQLIALEDLRDRKRPRYASNQANLHAIANSNGIIFSQNLKCKWSSIVDYVNLDFFQVLWNLPGRFLPLLRRLLVLFPPF